MTASALECSDIGFTYGEHAVLDCVSMSVGAGQVIGIIGPNGSGKTTLIKILSGLLIPRSGMVTLNGQDLATCTRKQTARALAVVTQEDRPDFGFTVRQEVMLGRAPHHGGLHFDGREDREIVDAAMQKSRVDHLAHRELEALSGGERQRVKIARGLAQQPQVLLLDEPTNHLDLYSQLSLMELMREINSDGIAIVLVSHDINFVAASCEQMSILHRGRFLISGAPELVITEENLRTAFNIHALVDRNPLTDRPRMTPLERLSTAEA